MIKLALLLALAQDPTIDDSPWGIAPSHSASWGVDNWCPVIGETGMRWMRGFFQAEPDRVLPAIEKAGYKVCGILAWSSKKPHTFPADDLPGWRKYIQETLAKMKGRVRYWEVWNEPPNFSKSDSPVEYGKIVAEAYKTVKEIDPTIQVGLACQSVNLNFLSQALAAGAAGNFDYVTVHPYEVMDHVEKGWEAQYMSIVPTIRKMLADKSPTKKDVPVWITECGTTVDKNSTQERQADQLVKVYTLSLAQGIKRIHWFEGIDGDSGPFGLIAGGNGKGQKRLSFTAMTQMIKNLGMTPKSIGWVLLDNTHYGFIFEGPVMATWSRPGTTAKVAMGGKVRVVRPRTGEVAEAEALDLTPSPTLVLDVPAALVAQAKANVGKPFPWGGDYTGATSVSWDATAGSKGLHLMGEAPIITLDGQPARDQSKMGGQSFTVDPNFNSYTSVPLKVTAVVRRTGDKAAGFNFKYESATGWKGGFGWHTIPEGKEWTTLTWTLKDPQFVGKWGFHFGLDSDSAQHSAFAIKSVTVAKE
jgi:hypothetical protein